MNQVVMEGSQATLEEVDPVGVPLLDPALLADFCNGVHIAFILELLVTGCRTKTTAQVWDDVIKPQTALSKTAFMHR